MIIFIELKTLDFSHFYSYDSIEILFFFFSAQRRVFYFIFFLLHGSERKTLNWNHTALHENRRALTEFVVYRLFNKTGKLFVQQANRFKSIFYSFQNWCIARVEQTKARQNILKYSKMLLNHMYTHYTVHTLQIQVFLNPHMKFTYIFIGYI